MKIQDIYTAAELVSAMKETGSHFFDRDAMRFFDSRGPLCVTPTPAGVYFVTSERFHSLTGMEPRRWTVRLWDGETVHECGEFQEHATRAAAMKALCQAVKEAHQ